MLVYFLFKGFIISSVIVGILTLFITQKSNLNTGLIILFLLVVAGHYIENLIFNSKFPKDRTALSLFLLYCLFLVASISNIAAIFKLKNSKRNVYVVLPIVGLFLFHFIHSMSFDHVFSWKYDADNKMVAMKVAELAKNENTTVSLSSDYILRPGINYYIHSKELPIQRVSKNGINKESDFVYTTIHEYDSLQYQLIKTYPLSGTILLKKNRSYKMK